MRLEEATRRVAMLEAVKCPECGAPLKFEEEREYCYCAHCGCQVYKKNNIEKRIVYRKIDEARIKEAEVRDSIHKRTIEYEAEQKRRQDAGSNKALLILLLAFVLWIMIIHIGLAVDENKQEKRALEAKEQGLVSAGYHSEYEGKNYSVVVAEMEARGFTNIEAIDLNDASFFSKNKDLVESISIAGDTSFSKYDYFNPEDKVIISYH